MNFQKPFINFTLLLITFLTVDIYAQQPPEVWISPDFNETTAGWDTTRFSLIQDGINAVAEAGTVHVGAGVYHESLIIQKQLHLIGEGPDMTEIDADDSLCVAVIEQVSDASISGISFTNSSWAGIHIKYCNRLYIQNNICYNNPHGINIVECENLTIDNNTVFENSVYGICFESSDSLTIQNNTCYDNGEHGMDISECENLIIENNTIYGNLVREIVVTNSHNNVIKNNIVNSNICVLILDASCGNLIENNEFYSAEHANVWLSSCSNNNRFVQNKIYGGPCGLIRSYFSSNNLYSNNEILGYKAGVCVSLVYSPNSVIHNNEMSGFHTWGMTIYHSDSTVVVGNRIQTPATESEWYLQGGISLYGQSCCNLIMGNEISDVPKGISLHHNSDYNQIINNKVENSSTGIIINTSNNNTIYRNNFIENSYQGFDNGNNDWSFNSIGNYWSDYADSTDCCNVDEVYHIYPNGLDVYPSESPFFIEPVVTPELKTVPYFEPVDSEIYITEEVNWTNQNKELTYLRILDGGSLTIENSTIIFSNQYSGVGGVYVNSGTALKIRDSEIFFNGVDSYIETGCEVEIKNTKLFNIGSNSGFEIYAENAIFTDNIIEDGIKIIFSSNSEIKNNYFKNVYIGIITNDNNSVISNNRILNVVDHGILLGGSNNKVYDNTISGCWGKSLRVTGDQNDIYRNNIVSHYNSISIEGGDLINNWTENEQGNYYSDYLDRYPAAKESALNDDQWDLPYANGYNIDTYPLRICFYNDTVINIPDQPLLIEPDSNASINSRGTTFKWLKDTKAETYRIQISEDSTFSLPIVNKGNIYDTTYCCLLDTNKTFYWRVISVNDGGHSHWSNIWKFNTQSATGIQIQANNNLPQKFTLYQNYPNPFNPSTTITFDLPRQSEVTIKVFDLLGNEVETIISKKYSAGRHKLEWNARNYSSGIYLYKLTADNYIGIKKFILLK